MKGLERHTILAIIILVILLIVAVAVFLSPPIEAQEKFKDYTEFRTCCLFWSLEGYSGTEIDDCEPSLEEVCKLELGKPFIAELSETDWENCRSRCGLVI